MRELLANASDALDKVRIRSAEDPSILSPNSELKIKVYSDKDNGTLTIEDSGIGMSRDDLVQFLGTLAKSGTAELLNQLLQKKDESAASNLIGQFGVGFYASFLVADSVKVHSSVAGSSVQYVWESKADAQEFTVSEDKDGTKILRGSRIVLHLKEDAKEYLDQEKLEELIKKYAQFFPHKIYLVKRVPEVSSSDISDDSESDDKDEVGENDKTNEEQKLGAEKKLVEKELLMNPNKPLWQRPPKEVGEDEYNAFYKSFFNDNKDPVTHVHFVGEGDINFRALFFVPSQAPYSPFSGKSEREELSKTVSLYVRRVFTKREQFFSEAMSSFIVGIIDSDELPLNVSRETLQNSESIEQIRRKSVNKVLDKLSELSESGKKSFDSFISAYGPNLNLEIIQNNTYRKRLSKLLKYQTTKTDGDNKKSLSEYVEGMKEGQKEVFFLCGRDISELRQSPLIEGFKEDDLEVILATESLDEYCLQALNTFEDHSFKNVAKEKAVENKVSEDLSKSFSGLIDWLKKDVLSEEVSEVILSSRLKESSCAVAASQYGLSGHMESVMRAQAGANNDPMLKFMEMQKKVLELNPKSAVILALKETHGKGQLEKAKDIVRTIYNGALIRSGFAVKNSKVFMDSIDRLAIKALEADEKSSESAGKSEALKKEDTISHDDL